MLEALTPPAGEPQQRQPRRRQHRLDLDVAGLPVLAPVRVIVQLHRRQRPERARVAEQEVDRSLVDLVLPGLFARNVFADVLSRYHPAVAEQPLHAVRAERDL